MRAHTRTEVVVSSAARIIRARSADSTRPNSLQTFGRIWHLIRVRRIGTILGGFLPCGLCRIRRAHAGTADAVRGPRQTRRHRLGRGGLKMEPGWHTYWKNPGAAGMPPKSSGSSRPASPPATSNGRSRKNCRPPKSPPTVTTTKSSSRAAQARRRFEARPAGFESQGFLARMQGSLRPRQRRCRGHPQHQRSKPKLPPTQRRFNRGNKSAKISQDLGFMPGGKNRQMTIHDR